MRSAVAPRPHAPGRGLEAEVDGCPDLLFHRIEAFLRHVAGLLTGDVGQLSLIVVAALTISH